MVLPVTTAKFESLSTRLSPLFYEEKGMPHKESKHTSRAPLTNFSYSLPREARYNSQRLEWRRRTEFSPNYLAGPQPCLHYSSRPRSWWRAGGPTQTTVTKFEGRSLPQAGEVLARVWKACHEIFIYPVVYPMDVRRRYSRERASKTRPSCEEGPCDSNSKRPELLRQGN